MNKWRNTPERYGCISQCLHWLMACLIIAMVIMGLLLDEVPGPYKPAAFMIHKSTGISLLALVVIRLGWRLANPPPPLPESMPKKHRLGAHAVHGLLYVLMFAMPLSGWLMSSAFGRSVTWFDMFTIPDLVGKDKDIADFFAGAHELLGNWIIAIVGIHVAAGLYHHFKLKDDVLKRMLPACCRCGDRKTEPATDAPAAG